MEKKTSKFLRGEILSSICYIVLGLCLVLIPEYHVPFPFHNHWYEDVRKFEEAAPGETVHFRYETQCGCNTEGVCWICDLRKKE